MGISQTHWTGQGKLIIAKGEIIIYLGREDEIRREGVGLILSKHAEKVMTDWKPITERLIKARLFSKNVKLTIIFI
jgi:hypothetical protein